AKGRLEVLREMDGAVSPEAMASIREDLADRFGTLPRPVEVLLRVFLLKHLLEPHGVRGVQRTGPDRLVVRHPPDRPLGGAWLAPFADVRTVEPGKTHLILPRRRGRKQPDWTGEQTLELLLEALSGVGATAKISACRTDRATRPRRRSPSA